MKLSEKGFSLIEVTISSTVLALVVTGVTAVTMMTSRIAYHNIYENTAHTVAQAYGEQLKSINYAVLKQAFDDPSTYEIPTESLSLGASETSETLKEADPLIFGVPVQKDVVVDIEDKAGGGFTERVMRMWITVNGSEMETSAGCWDALEISMDYEWEVVDQTGVNRRSGRVLIVRTNVTDY